MIAISGALMIGVETMPPSRPRLVIVIVEPASSSFFAFPVRAPSDTRRISEVDAVVAHDHVALGIVDRVALGEVAEHAHERGADERQERERRLALRLARVQVLAQRLEFGDVDFLDVREVRDVALRLGHAVRDHAAHADHLDLLRAGARGRDGGGRDAARGAGA
jgi:hypothetical protein